MVGIHFAGSKVQKIARQVLAFSLGGVLNTAVDSGVFWILEHGMHWAPWWAQVISYLCGFCNSFLWNRRFTFERKGMDLCQVGRFALVNAISLVVSICALLWLRHSAMPMMADKLCVTAITMLINFAGGKWWVWRDNDANTIQSGPDSAPCRR
ncbi:GtrA family protein [Alicyclobacillus hesperidum]|uniref:GtrA family protein n=1 Tax=Alicyclobacillus hesperidum TaxID=89784 RepID=UPI0007190B64